MDHRYQYPTCC